MNYLIIGVCLAFSLISFCLSGKFNVDVSKFGRPKTFKELVIECFREKANSFVDNYEAETELPSQNLFNQLEDYLVSEQITSKDGLSKFFEYFCLLPNADSELSRLKRNFRIASVVAENKKYIDNVTADYQKRICPHSNDLPTQILYGFGLEIESLLQKGRNFFNEFAYVETKQYLIDLEASKAEIEHFRLMQAEEFINRCGIKYEAVLDDIATNMHEVLCKSFRTYGLNDQQRNLIVAGIRYIDSFVLSQANEWLSRFIYKDDEDWKTLFWEKLFQLFMKDGYIPEESLKEMQDE